MFLPTTLEEIKKIGWKNLQIIIVSGDSYIDTSFMGAALIGKVLLKAGFRVGIIAQPDVKNSTDITRLGAPELFWGITSGCVDSMVSNYTSTGKRRKNDDFTPGGKNNRRPNRAVIVYANLIRKYFHKTVPIVLGGIEASLRRVAHYDYWSNSIRRSILLDSKGDILIYGMAERSIVQVANSLLAKKNIDNIRSICYMSSEIKEDFLPLPTYEEVINDKELFVKMFELFYKNNDPLNGKGLYQKYGNRYLIHNPMAKYLTQSELDEIYSINFENDLHPFYKKQGKVKALETIKFSITSHRGCYGDCNFCAISVHQGRTIRWRSENSIVKEVKSMRGSSGFKNIIHDVGGPTLNMYGYECSLKLKKGACKHRSCIYPDICSKLPIDHSPQINLLKHLRKVEGIKKVFLASGLRYDLVLKDDKHGLEYLEDVVKEHVSGQLKIAPEHTEEKVLKQMRKPSSELLIEFKNHFDRLSKKYKKKQFLTYYFIVAHPGCTMKEMKKMRNFIKEKLRLNPEQVQIFTPTPSTWSSVMYYMEKNPFTGKKIFVEKTQRGKILQKQKLIDKRNVLRKSFKR